MRSTRQPSLGAVGAAIALAAWGGLALLGCDSSRSTGPSTHYSLAVTITTPAGVTPSVTVSGPAGYQRTLTATETLTSLAPGSYTVTAGPAIVPHAIVATIYDGTITGAPEPVVLGPDTMATASVTYAPRPGSGALWVGSAGSSNLTLLAYSATQLAATTSAAPAITLESFPLAAGAPAPVAVAFDATGELWTAANYDDQGANIGMLLGFLVIQLQAGTPAPPTSPAFSLTATSGGGEFLGGMTFDPSGSVWVTNHDASTVVEFTSPQFGVQVSPAPAVTLTAASGSLSGPAGLAFDPNFDLWVANATGNTLVRFAAGQLAASGSPTPAVTLGATNGSLDGPCCLAFDASGNLWVANTNASTVVEFTAGQLAIGGSPAPAVTLSATNGSLNAPSGLAFDASGDLWVANAAGGTVVEFHASQLAASGAPTPLVTLSGSALSGAHGLAFDPPPFSFNSWDY